MKISFRYYHLFRILSLFEKSPYPIDFFLKHYFRVHKQLGSKDRKEICAILYSMIRYKGLIDYYAKKPFTPENRYFTYQKIKNKPLDPNLAPYLKVSFPKEYFTLIENSYGTTKALQICSALNTEAPITIRVNTLKTTREVLYNQWKNKYPIRLAKQSPNALVFSKRMNFFCLPEFQQGLFEVQDEGSQLIADLIQAKPKDHVLDYCAGSGGKTLALAPKLQKSGQIYLHDIRPKILKEAKKRLKRAGIENAQELGKTKQKMDWILLDVPCSGSGTLRRNPDQKWSFSLKNLHQLVVKQRTIFKESLKYVKASGSIVYATCSLLPIENEEQVKYFLQTYPVKLVSMHFWLPEKEGKDGFFGAVFTYR